MPAHHPRLAMTGAQLRGCGELHIVGVHDSVTIADPDGAIQRLLRLADGRRSRDEIVGALTGEFAQLAAGELEDAIAELEAIGVLADVAPRARLLAGR